MTPSLSPEQRADLGLETAVDAVAPRDESEVRALLQEAARGGHALVPVGGGTLLGLGRPPERCTTLLFTERLAGIREHSAEDFVVTVGAGTRLRDLQHELQPHGQWVAVEPPERDVATVGGLLGAAAPSLLSASLGTLRNHLLGVRVAYSDGTVAKAGGRVVKNVSGYDLMKLHHGGLGAFGVILEATLRLRPIPEQDLLLTGPVPGYREALEHLAAVEWPQDPAAVHVVSSAADSGELALAVRLQGAARAVEDQSREIRAALAARGVALEAAEVPTTGRAVRHPILARLEDLLGRGFGAATVHVSLHFPRSRAAVVLAAVESFVARAACPVESALDAGRGILWCRFPDAAAGAAGRWVGLLSALRATLKEKECLLILRAAPAEVRRGLDPVPLPAALRRVARALKQNLDPGNVLCPGRHALDEP